MQSNSEMIEFMEDVVRSISGKSDDWSMLVQYLRFIALNVSSSESFREQNILGAE